MAKLWTAAALVGVLVAHASPGFAQDAAEVAPLPLPSHSLPVELVRLTPEVPAFLFSAGDDLSELQRWVDAFTDWQAWSSRWRSQREPGFLTSYRERRQKPSPPSWLAARCSLVLDEADTLATPCELFELWASDDLDPPALRTATVLGGAQEREPHKTWWENVHIDLMWPDLQFGSSTYGVVGMHHSTTIKGRLQVFTAPGALLLNLPSYHGTRTWKVAVNYGIGYRLFEFGLFGSRPAELHFNLAKTWIVSDVSDVGMSRSIDVVGFSLTFKKRGP